MNLQKLTLEEFAGEFITKTQAIEEFYKLCHGIKAGNTISLLFNPHRLSTDNEKDDLSVYESLFDDHRLSGLARLYLYNLEHGINNAFYVAIQRGYQNIQYINEFPPFVARTVYLDYSLKKEKLKILDPCAGWGGRMIGCASIPNTTYVACEPSTKTYEGLLKLGEWLKALQPTFEYKVYKLPYEEFETDEKFDIALTSPPYYNTEHYSDEPTNSMNKFTTFETWIEGFYKPLISNTVNRLTDDGAFILNVGDRKYPLSDNMYAICKDIGIECVRIHDYLGGLGETKEKFYCISKKHFISSMPTLF
jgi:hypothetical protein